MTDLQEIYRAVDQLSANEKEQLRAYLDRPVEYPAITDEDIEAKIARLHEALEHFWDGLSQEEIDAIVEDMNAEYIEPLEDDWLGDEDNP